MTMPHMKNASIISGIIGVLIILAIVLGLGNTIFIRPSYNLIGTILSAPIFAIAIVLAAVLAVIGLFGNKVGFYVLGGAFAVIGLGSLIFQPYLNDRAVYQASAVEITEDADSLSFAERVPFDVASAVSNRSLGDTQGDATGRIKTVPSDSTYTTSVIRRGIAKGYESVQVMDLPMYGSFNFSENVKFCAYNENANLRLGGGWFNNNMEMRAYRKVSALNPTVRIDYDDAFAVCDGEVPMLYMPATKLVWKGVAAYRVPAGVVTYNGSNGEFNFEKNMEVDGISIYPISLAYEQRSSTRASGNLIDYWRGVVGWEGTDKDADDVNSGNSTEFSMASADDSSKTAYVTPLTPRGGSTSVVGLSTVDSHKVEYGKLNPLVIHSYSSPRQAPSTISSDLISTEFEGYRAQGLTVFEVVPSRDGNWTVSIGKNQSILYRAVIDHNGKMLELTDAEGAVGSSAEDAEGEESASVSKPVSEMTVDELAELSNLVNEELAERARAAEAPAEEG